MKKHLATLLKVLVSGTLLGVLYCRIDVQALAERVATVDFRWIALAFVLLTLNTLVSSVKWRLLLAADGIHQPTWSLFASHLIGSFFNLFLPSTIGGDAYRIADIGQRTSKTVRTAASILADRITGFLALAIYGLVAAFAARSHFPGWDNKLLILPALALCALLAFSFALWQQGLLRRICSWMPKKIQPALFRILDPILDSIQAYLRRPAVCWGAMFFSFVFQLDAILCVWSLTKALGLGIGPWPFFFFVPFITLMEMIPVSIFGIGLRDTGYVWFMDALGRADPKGDAAAISLLYVAATVLYVGIGGILFIFRRRPGKKGEA